MINRPNCWNTLRAHNTTTWLATANVMVKKAVGLGNQQPSVRGSAPCDEGSETRRVAPTSLDSRYSLRFDEILSNRRSTCPGQGSIRAVHHAEQLSIDITVTVCAKSATKQRGLNAMQRAYANTSTSGTKTAKAGSTIERRVDDKRMELKEQDSSQIQTLDVVSARASQTLPFTTRMERAITCHRSYATTPRATSTLSVEAAMAVSTGTSQVGLGNTIVAVAAAVLTSHTMPMGIAPGAYGSIRKRRESEVGEGIVHAPMRVGDQRVDELWFVDLPNIEEREAIFKVHLSKRGRDASKFNIKVLAQQTEKFSGAEIEAAIVTAMFSGFSEDREFTTGDIELACSKTVPLATTKGEELESFRKKARARCALASSPMQVEATDNRFGSLDVM